MVADERLVCDLRGFIAEAGLAATDAAELLGVLSHRLRREGLPVSRFVVAWRTLDPLIYAKQITWTTRTVSANDFSHEEREEREADVDRPDNPLRHVVENQLAVLRCDLTKPQQQFAQLTEFAREGHTDYLAGIERFGPVPLAKEEIRGAFFSICSDAPGGLGAAADVFLAIRPTLALAFRAIIEQRQVQAVARTYLGPLAAERVLAGAIRRGDAEVIPAAIWYSDLRSFTPMSEVLPLDDTIAFLNEAFEATAGAVEAAGGEVLDFIGDGVLAIFPLADDGVRRALGALDDALMRLDLVRERHADDPRPVIQRTLERGLVGIALAIGDVRFGNIGTGERLSFSVIGPTVNTVARIEGLTKVLGERALVTEAIAAAAPHCFVDCGEHMLEGVQEPRRLFGLASTSARAAVPCAAEPVAAS